MRTLDDAWNAGPNSPLWETFKKCHNEHVVVYWPNQPLPTKGRQNHDADAKEFFKTFDNKLINNPYKISLGQEDYTCTVADWIVSMKGPMKGPDGKTI
jgi:hypothetical protein